MIVITMPSPGGNTAANSMASGIAGIDIWMSINREITASTIPPK